MCKVQEKAKNERQNDDYATTNTNPNSSSHHDEAHHVRRRLSQTITSRSCLLIAIALASLSAHACDDTVELQVTCDSAETPWFVTSSDASGENTTVTVGSCFEGRVKDVAQVKGNDIDTNTNGIVICSESKVCYHLKWISGDQIEVKNCDGDGDPICNYICYDNSFTRKGNSNLDVTAREPINDNIICDNSTNNAYIYECNGNIIVGKTPCPNGCAENGAQCKHYKCKSGKRYECKDGTLFKCGNAQDVATQVANNMVCNENGEVVFCDKNSVKSSKHTCEGDQVVFCKDNRVELEMRTCEGDQVVWCKPNEPTPRQTDCLPSSQNDDFIACKDLNVTRRICDENGNILLEESCSNGQTKCAGDLNGRVDCDGKIINACQYCYNKSIENNFTSIEKLVCKGCEPNEYKRKESTGSTLNPMDEVCYNGKLVKFDSAKGSDFILFPQSNRNGLWEFALNVTVALPEGLSPNPPANQFQTLPQRTWRYYNCHNDAMKFLTEQPEVNNVNDFLELLKNSNKCCDENSYYITQTGYRYYSVEKCTNIALYDTNKNASIPTNFSAYAYTTELNDFLIGTEHDLLAKDYACLKSKDTNAVRHMMFIKQQANGDQESQDGEPKHGIYKAFECPEDYKCDLKNRYKGLCISENENVPSNSNCSCNNNTIMCGSVIIAACPKGTTPRIVGDSDQTSCDGQSTLKLDQIQCVPDSQSTAEQ